MKQDVFVLKVVLVFVLSFVAVFGFLAVRNHRAHHATTSQSAPLFKHADHTVPVAAPLFWDC